MRAKKHKFIAVEPSSLLGKELVEGMATEPTIFGRLLILQGGWVIYKNGGQLSFANVTKQVAEEIADIKDKAHLEECGFDKQKRYAMMDAAPEIFLTEVDLEKYVAHYL